MIKSTTFTIVTSDLERAIRFYKDVLFIPMVHTVPGLIAVFQTGGTSFTLYQDRTGDALRPARVWEDFKAQVIAGFLVDEPLSEVRRRIETEVTIRAEASPEESPFNMLFIEDFDGNEICLSELKGSL